jgi:hypothetical protein
MKITQLDEKLIVTFSHSEVLRLRLYKIWGSRGGEDVYVGLVDCSAM